MAEVTNNKVDYLSTLNAGSGLNTTQIIDALVDAEIVPQENQLKDRIEEKNVSISGMGQVTQSLTSLKTVLGGLDGNNGLSVSSSGSSVGISISDAALAKEFSHDVNVTQLAKAQTLVFDGFSSDSVDLGAGSLAFSFGAWDSSSFTADSSAATKTVTIGSSSSTLVGIRDAVNDANIGVTASIIQKTSTNFAFGFQSSTGANKEMMIVATETTANSGLAGIGFSTFNASKETVAGTDANFTVDGIAIVRDTNKVTDLQPGIELELKSTTSSAEKVSSKWSSSEALTVLKDYVNTMNGITSSLAELTKRDADGAGDGPLAGDPFVSTIQRKLRSLTTDAIVGYGANSIYLSNFGVRTERDGTLKIDETQFKKSFDSDPSSFSALVSSRATSTSALVSATVSGTTYVPGSYSFAISSGTASLGGTTMSGSSGTYYLTSGNAAGVTATVSSGSPSATIYLGRSLINSVSDYVDTLLKTNGDLDLKVKNMNDDLSDLNLETTNLTKQTESLRERYQKRFGAMEAAVSQLKDTGEYLTSFMDSWTAGLKK